MMDHVSMVQTVVRLPPDVQDRVVGPPQDPRHPGVGALHQLLPLVPGLGAAVPVTTQSRLLADAQI